MRKKKYRQDVTEKDFIYHGLSYFNAYFPLNRMSIEVKEIVEHFIIYLKEVQKKYYFENKKK
jgi:hypothetical protein